MLEVDIHEAVAGGGRLTTSRFRRIRSERGSTVQVDNDTAVYGLGAMSLWMPELGSNPSFKIVRLDEIYAGTELILSLFDRRGHHRHHRPQLHRRVGRPGLPLSGPRRVPQRGPGVGRVTTAVPGAIWRSPNKEYNNQWIDFRFADRSRIHLQQRLLGVRRLQPHRCRPVRADHLDGSGRRSAHPPRSLTAAPSDP